MVPPLPEELTIDEIHDLVAKLRIRYPKVFLDCIDMNKLSSFHKLIILDNMLMDHPDLYCSLFRQSQEQPER